MFWSSLIVSGSKNKKKDCEVNVNIIKEVFEKKI